MEDRPRCSIVTQHPVSCNESLPMSTGQGACGSWSVQSRLKRSKEDAQDAVEAYACQSTPVLMRLPRSTAWGSFIMEKWFYDRC